MNDDHPSTLQPTNWTDVAVGIVSNTQGQVLYTQRPLGKPYQGWWEFPGGKLEQGETLAQALVRELKEELDISILDCHHWLTQQFIYPHARVRLLFCKVHQFKGTVKALEQQAFVWGDVNKPPLPFLPAALPVIKALQLPALIHQSKAALLGLDAWRQTLDGIPRGMLILDEPTLTPNDATKAFEHALAWRNNNHAQRKLVIHSRHPMQWWGLADGVHLSSEALKLTRSRPSYAWVGASIALQNASGKEILHHANAVGCNYVTIEHQMSPNHMQSQVQWAQVSEMLLNCPVASYVNANLTDHQLPFAYAAGANGLVI